MSAVPLTGIDKCFFHVESENHLMTIGSCLTFKEHLSKEEILEPLIKMSKDFPKFRQRVTKSTKFTKERLWEDYDFDINQHINEIDLTQTSNNLQNTLSELMSKPLDNSIALWQSDLIHYENKSALFTRVHHCVTDGQGAIRCLLSLTTNSKNTSELQYGKTENTNQNQTNVKKQTIPQYKKLFFKTLFIISFLFQCIMGVLDCLWNFFAIFLFFKRKHFVKELTNQKIVSFTDNVSLDEVKTIKNHFNVSVNDVLISSLAGSFRDFILSNDGKIDDPDLLTYIPFSMRKSDDWSLGNKVSIVWAKLPLNISDPIERLMEVNKRMTKIKNSKEPLATYFFTTLIGNSPLADLSFSKSIMKYALGKPHAIFTNVPGPKDPLKFAGKTIDNFYPFIPQPGDGGCGIALLSYHDKVSCSLVSDKTLFSDGGYSITNGLNSQIQILKNLIK